MTQYELAQNLMFRLARISMEVYEYAANWSDEFSKQHIIERIESLKNDNSFKTINPTKFTEAELINLGFGIWQDNGMYLIPFWMCQFLEDGFDCISITGEKVIFNEETCDNDHRYGQLAYQVKPYAGEK